MTIITFYGRNTDVKLMDIFLECTKRYANPLIVWKTVKTKEGVKVIIQADDGEERKLTGKITLERIETTIQKMKTPSKGEMKGGSNPNFREVFMHRMIP